MGSDETGINFLKIKGQRSLPFIMRSDSTCPCRNTPTSHLDYKQRYGRCQTN